jgi:hypothetical protein
MEGSGGSVVTRTTRPGNPERRSNGLLRVPFVRRCELSFDDGTRASAFLVNISLLGAYVALDQIQMPLLNRGVTGRFPSPLREREVVFRGTVTWLNPKQQHPVHSLPPGFGLKLHALDPDDQRCIEEIVEEYIARNPQAAS